MLISGLTWRGSKGVFASTGAGAFYGRLLRTFNPRTLNRSHHEFSRVTLKAAFYGRLLGKFNPRTLNRSHYKFSRVTLKAAFYGCLPGECTPLTSTGPTNIGPSNAQGSFAISNSEKSHQRYLASLKWDLLKVRGVHPPSRRPL